MDSMPLKVLLVEDNPEDARLLQEIFSESTAYDAVLTHVESLAAAETHIAGHATDLIVLDLGLPDAQGLEGARRIRTVAPLVPLVVLTCQDSGSLAVQALREGVHDYLVKGQIDSRGVLRSLHLAVEREALRRKLVQQQRELERSNADLEQFAYAASHDLKAPLRAIAHLAQWIDEDVRPTASPDTISNLTLLNGRAVRLQTMLDGMLAYARIGQADSMVEDVNIAEIVDAVVDMLELPPGFSVVCEEKATTIRTSRAPIHMILTNLITNAVQHHDRSEGRVAVSMRLLDGKVEIRVSDDGPGIATRFQERIFTIFQTLQSRDDRESNGIGLAMVKKQVSRNGGEVWIESTPPHRGTSFVFTWMVAGQAERPSDQLADRRRSIDFDEPALRRNHAVR
jgi:signal transduction histidine kinase